MERAAVVAGITPRSAYHRRRIDREFGRQWATVARIGTALLEEEACRRAYHGTPEPVFYKGTQCGSITRYSDQLLTTMLKARRPEVYREGAGIPQVNISIQANVAAVQLLNGLPLDCLDVGEPAGPEMPVEIAQDAILDGRTAEPGQNPTATAEPVNATLDASTHQHMSHGDHSDRESKVVPEPVSHMESITVPDPIRGIPTHPHMNRL